MVHPLTREAWKLHDKNNRCHSCKFHDSQGASNERWNGRQWPLDSRIRLYTHFLILFRAAWIWMHSYDESMDFSGFREYAKFFKTILFFFFFMKLFLIFIIKCSSSFFCKSGEKGTGGKFGEGRVQVRLERGIIKIEGVSLNERGLSYSMLSNVNTTLFLLTQIIFAARLHVYRRLVIFLSFS